MTQNETFEGEVVRITFENTESAFRVVKVAVKGRVDPIAVVGTFPPVSVGARIRVSGARVVDKSYGEQIRATNVTELSPDTLAGLTKYLGSGIVKGVGKRTAERIVSRFKMDTMRVLDEDPKRLTEVEGLGKTRAAAIVTAWRDQRGIREIMVFLQAHGASPALAHRIHKRFGQDAAHVVAEHPYRLALEVSGIGFITADRVAREVGIARDAPERLQAAVLHVLGEETESGHVHSPAPLLLDRAAQLTSTDDRPALERALDAIILSGLVVPGSHRGERVYYTRAMYAAETRLATTLATLAQTKPNQLEGTTRAIEEFERHAKVTLALEQRLAVETAAKAQVMVVTGGPGVGKTTVLRALLALFREAKLDVRLASPTGRAAKRMAEATGRPAQTVHRLLEIDPETKGFVHGPDLPLHADVVIVDEASMLDLSLADSLCAALAKRTRLVLVGDVDQLPSVGPGAVLRDVIASKIVPCVRLHHIFRQGAGSLIVDNAHRINGGERPISPPKGVESDFFVVDMRDAIEARAMIIKLVKERIPQRFGLHPVRDVQVLTPMNKGEVGTVALNAALQEALNPNGATLVHGSRSFRCGDKVMQTRNDYESDVYNGDLGIVSRIDLDADTLTVRFDGRDVTYEGADIDDIVLAYACTVHKSQGSEYPAAIVVMLSAHFVMLSRNLLYTAVTRGKRLVTLIADPRAIATALKEDRKNDRRTSLAQRMADHVEGLKDR